MRKELFESNEEVLEVFSICGVTLSDDGLNKIRSLGLVKKTIVEEVEEMWAIVQANDMSMTGFEVKLYEAIRYLKKQLEEK